MLTRNQLEIARQLGRRASVGGRSIVGGRALVGADEIDEIVDEQVAYRLNGPSQKMIDDAVRRRMAERLADNAPLSVQKRTDLRRLPVGIVSAATIANGAAATVEFTPIWDTKPVFLVAGPPADPTAVAAFRIDAITIQGRSQIPGNGSILLDSLQGVAPVALNLDTIPQNGKMTFSVFNIGAATGFFRLTMFADCLVET